MAALGLYGRWGLLLWPAFCGHCRLGEAAARPSVRGCSGAGRSGWGLRSGPTGLGLPGPSRRCCGPGSSPETLSSSCMFRVHSLGPASAAACPSNGLSLCVCVSVTHSTGGLAVSPAPHRGPAGSEQGAAATEPAPALPALPAVPGLPSRCAGVLAQPCLTWAHGLACGCVRSGPWGGGCCSPKAWGPLGSPCVPLPEELEGVMLAADPGVGKTGPPSRSAWFQPRPARHSRASAPVAGSHLCSAGTRAGWRTKWDGFCFSANCRPS